MHLRVEQARLVVVEGKDEEFFFSALLEHLGLSGVQIVPIGGKSKLRENLKALVRLPGFRQKVTHVGIVRDADDDARAAFQSLRD